MMREFYVPGKPKGKGRPRFSRGHAYTPKTTHDYERLIKQSYLLEHRNTSPIKGACSMHITAVFTLPKSMTKKERTRIIEADEFPLKKPDVDNIAKVVLDALNGIAYEDDVQVVTLKAHKLYDHQTPHLTEGLYITIHELEETEKE